MKFFKTGKQLIRKKTSLFTGSEDDIVVVKMKYNVNDQAKNDLDIDELVKMERKLTKSFYKNKTLKTIDSENNFKHKNSDCKTIATKSPF